MPWDPYSPQSWAETLGLAAVPMFGPSGPPNGDNAWVMLDGKRASFSFLLSGSTAAKFDHALHWSWSAFVRHLISINQSAHSLTIRRWDAPSYSQTIELPLHGKLAADIVYALQSAAPPRAPDCISYVLDVFRALRRRLRADSPNAALSILNCLLLALKEIRAAGAPNTPVTNLRELFSWLQTTRGMDLREIELPTELPDQFNITDLLSRLAQPEPFTGCLLFPHILLRHASSYLYQEAHLQIERDAQLYLFEDVADAVIIPGTEPRDVRYTPPNLARALAREALHLLPSVPQLVVLDPACGSGVFLQEFVREAMYAERATNATLLGYDISPICRSIAPFATALASEECLGGEARFRYAERDSLVGDWERADVILMNPPFRSWQAMSGDEQERVREILGDLTSGRPDLAAAFLWKACQSINSGGVIACVLPAPLLESTSLRALREAIARTFRIDLIGRFAGYSYFSASLVETAFIVLKQGSPSAHMPRLVMASEGNEDLAIRKLRGADVESALKESSGYAEIFSVDRSLLSDESWLPRRQQQYELYSLLRTSGLPTVDTLFTVHQGVRTGYNDAFLLSEQEMWALPQKEQACFRPVAGQGAILAGMLKACEYIFYPFNPAGPVFNTEQELKKKLPVYYKGWLAPNRNQLESRKKIAAWWLPTWPRTWQFTRQKKLVTAYFGGPGSFALDMTGDHVVVSGFAWFWKESGEPTDEGSGEAPFWDSDAPFAYLALLNSSRFDEVLECVSWRLQGGQKRLEPRFVNRAYLPNLLDDNFPEDVRGTLANLGIKIANGQFAAIQKELEVATDRAYIT